jgi:RHS repeat-associated protein
VTQEYAYSPSHGRIASRVTKAGGNTFGISYVYDSLGDVTKITYPQLAPCSGCASVGLPRTVTNSYNQGQLVGVSGYASSISYYANGVVNTVAHQNNTTDKYTIDTKNYLPRPASITSTLVPSSPWSVSYTYDAAGNVVTMGPQSFRYDKVGRLAEATIPGQPTQSYQYDANGNITNLVTVDGATNRLSGATYDDAGNLKTWTDPRSPGITSTYEWDALSMMTYNRDARQGRIYLYDATDERTAVFDFVSASPNIQELWTARGVGNAVLRDFVRVRKTGGETVSWTWRDSVYRGGVLLALVRPAGSSDEAFHVHVDHLGSTRRVSKPDGTLFEQREFYPFGQEIGEKLSETRFRFTGHEHDDNGSTDPFGDLEYMHARYYASVTGKFLALDPEQGDPSMPQSWNRYAYSRNNPLRLIDPDGRDGWDVVSGVGQGLKNFGVHTVEGVKTLFTDPGAVVDGLKTVVTNGTAAYFTAEGRRNLAANWEAADTQERTAVVTEALTNGVVTVFGPKVVGAGVQRAGLGAAAGRTFWGGVGTQAVAEAIGATIGKTPLGRAMIWIETKTGTQAWAPLSRAYARGASGDVNVVVAEAGGKILMTEELPILVNNPNVTSITFIGTDGVPMGTFRLAR